MPNFRVLNLKKTAWTLDAYQNCGGKREPACKEADYLVPGINIDVIEIVQANDFGQSIDWIL